MQIINIHEAKTHFSKLIDSVSNGEEILIAKAGKPVAKLVNVTSTQNKVKFGVLKEEIRIAEDFDAPLPDELLGNFEGKCR